MRLPLLELDVDLTAFHFDFTTTPTVKFDEYGHTTCSLNGSEHAAKSIDISPKWSNGALGHPHWRCQPGDVELRLYARSGIVGSVLLAGIFGTFATIGSADNFNVRPSALSLHGRQHRRTATSTRKVARSG